jgi:hypothetical protein
MAVRRKIFISYRRDDSEDYAGRINDELVRRFERDVVFLDVDAMPPGADFVNALSAAVAKCTVLLAIIGPRWIDARDEAGRRRLDNEHDFVRVEIAEALKREVPVIPILRAGTRMQRAEQLPDNLKDLAATMTPSAPAGARRQACCTVSAALIMLETTP